MNIQKLSTKITEFQKAQEKIGFSTDVKKLPLIHSKAIDKKIANQPIFDECIPPKKESEFLKNLKEQAIKSLKPFLESIVKNAEKKGNVIDLKTLEKEIEEIEKNPLVKLGKDILDKLK